MAELHPLVEAFILSGPGEGDSMLALANGLSKCHGRDLRDALRSISGVADELAAKGKLAAAKQLREVAAQRVRAGAQNPLIPVDFGGLRALPAERNSTAAARAQFASMPRLLRA